ncbi:MAG TPA: PepSY-associated TM helix domain-containing protein [Nitrospiraceae bacterium]|nr:PepSY-associated TM helix domain-containing protein [Nitrospiraceae bacterium]
MPPLLSRSREPPADEPDVRSHKGSAVAPMKDSFTQSMDWLHTWSGLLFGWLLFAIFLTGTLTVFDKEITYWMQPELHQIQTSSLPNVDAASRHLAKLGGDSDHWWIQLPTTRIPVTKIFWKAGDSFEERLIDPVSGDVLTARETRGGDFFYRFHYQLHLDDPGVWMVGTAAMVMLVALVTGLAIHHRFFKDFFTFRPKSSPHRAWLDLHNVTSVLVLPFHFMITFTGLVIFWQIYMPAGVHLFYGGDPEKVFDDLEQHIELATQHSPAQLVSLPELERVAREHWHGGTTEWIEVKHPGDRGATVEITRLPDDRLALISDRVTFDGATGEILQVWNGDRPAFLTYSVMIGLHYLWFDRSVIRWLYFLMGLAASTMIATGLVLWTVKRRARQAAHEQVYGYRAAERLNIAVIAGLPVAVGSFFWANRLFPMDLADRAQWEMRVFFLVWALCAVHAFLIQDAHVAWKKTLCASAILFALLPALNMVTTQSHLLITLPAHTWRLAGVDLAGMAAGLLAGWGAWRISRPVESAMQVGREPVLEPKQV